MATAATHQFARNIAPAVARSILEPGQKIVKCRWWTGSYPIDPSRFVIDGNNSLMKEDCQPNSLIAQEMRAKYDDVGVIHVQNTGLKDMALQRDLARVIMGDETEYEGGANPRGRNEELGNVYDIGAPLTAALAYHHETTYKSHSVETLGFLCKHAVNRGDVGWSFVSDSVQAHDFLMQHELGQKLKDKGLCFLRRMTDAEGDNSAYGSVYNHWQQSWMTNDPVEAEEAAKRQGLQVEWIFDNVQGRIMQTKYYKSAFEYIPSRDRNILVTSIADDGEWFDSWPGIQDIPTELRPLEMTFGDDEPITLAEKQFWTDAYDLYGIPLPWKAGDVAVLCNLQYAHGRPGVHLRAGEQRELGVMLGPLFERKETLENKW